MARKVWDALSVAYRGRLQRAGVDQAAYDAGASLKAARGHARTPERPAQASRRPGAYPDYVRRHGVKTTIPGGEAYDVGPDVPDDELRGWLAGQASTGRSVSARVTYDDLGMYGGARGGPGDFVLFSHRGYQARRMLRDMGRDRTIRAGLDDMVRQYPDVEHIGRITRVQLTAYTPRYGPYGGKQRGG